jgi:hypothetical protein
MTSLTQAPRSSKSRTTMPIGVRVRSDSRPDPATSTAESPFWRNSSTNQAGRPATSPAT